MTVTNGYYEISGINKKKVGEVKKYFLHNKLDKIKIKRESIMLIPEKYGLADIIVEIAGIQIVKTHVPGPQGVRGRDSDNTHPVRFWDESLKSLWKRV